MSLSHVIEENDQTRARREHLEEVRRLVGNTYPNKYERTDVARTAGGEDTVSALTDRETLKRVAADDSFAAAFDALAEKVARGARPTPEDLAPVNEGLNKITVRVAGRLATPPRVMGKAAFVHLSDGRSRLQIYVRKDDARAVSNDTGLVIDEDESGWRLFQLLDHGDFVGVEGFLFATKTGELSVHVKTLKFLSKALLPMPDKMHGVSDPEIRQRRRYVDLLAGSLKVEREPGESTPREVFERRSYMIRELRRYLDEHGFVEVETPILSPLASGAAARPFKTHHNALGIDLYARIAPELYLKRLLVGGFERVYELNRNFRNEGIDRTHSPEFTMLEFYAAYMDANGMMDFCEALLRATIEKAHGGARVRYGEEEIDFGRPFARLTMKQAINEYLPDEYKELGSEPYNETWLDDPTRLRRLTMFLRARTSDADFNKSAWQIAESQMRQLPSQTVARDDSVMANEVAEIFEQVAEEHLIQPTFIHDYPKPISPLSKASPADPTIAERFELFVAGFECANGFSELNDPEEQLRRFDEQMRQRERGDDEAMQKDEDYIRALAYGMPPAAGIGIGVDRIAMLLANRRTIRDVILFPHMRPLASSDKTEAGGEEEAGGEPAPPAP
ncbi:MAG TPA: lysine--tRNA ligase [Pyrinomonadaceae bacterium]|nr:lysine--tRNA ligase [Pyrinomonadaceae bacterium]